MQPAFSPVFPPAMMGFLLIVSGLWEAELPAAELPKKPNILLILADDVGCEPLGCFGGESYQTPRIDGLAASGLKFENCYAMPVCHPTRITLLTGKYPFRWNHPAWGTFPKAAEKATLPHFLKRAGYSTAIAGKWQLTLLKDNPQHPHQLGFDEYCLFGWHEGPRYFQPLIWQNGAIRNDVADRYGPDVYSDSLISFMERHREESFFAFYSMALCHDVTDDLQQPVPFGPDGRYQSYGEMVEQMDHQVGKLLDAMDRLNLRKNTLILFTGDNGTAKNSIISFQDGKYLREPVFSMIDGKKVRGGKGELTNAGTHVPLIASWPEVIEAGTTTRDLVDLSDILPTLVELAGKPVPEEIDGRSFTSTLSGKMRTNRPWVFAEHQKQFWVRNLRWKLYDDDRVFDLQNDPGEQHPLTLKEFPEQSVEEKLMLLNARKQLHPRQQP